MIRRENSLWRKLINKYFLVLPLLWSCHISPALASQPRAEEIRAEAERFIDFMKRDGVAIMMNEQTIMQEFLLRSRERAFDIADFAARGEAKEFNDLNEYLFESYAVDPSSRNSILVLIDALSEASRPHRQERQVRTSYGDMIDGVMWTTTSLMLVRIGLRLAKVGTFERVGRLAHVARSWVYSIGRPRSNLPTTIFARPEVRIPWARFQQLSPGRQFALAVGLGAAWGLADFTVYHLSTEYVDPAPVLEALQAFLAYHELALPICGLARQMRNFEANTLHSIPENTAPPEAVAEQMRKYVAEVRRLTGLFAGTRALAPHLMEARTVTQPGPSLSYRFETRRQDTRYDVASCRTEGVETVALTVMSPDLMRLTNIGRAWAQRWPQAFPQPTAPNAANGAAQAQGQGAGSAQRNDGTTVQKDGAARATAPGANAASAPPAAGPNFRGESLAPSRAGASGEVLRPPVAISPTTPGIEESERALLPLPNLFSAP